MNKRAIYFIVLAVNLLALPVRTSPQPVLPSLTATPVASNAITNSQSTVVSPLNAQLTFDVSRDEIQSNSDFAILTASTAIFRKQGPDFSNAISARNGADFFRANEGILFSQPTNGYQMTNKIPLAASETQYHRLGTVSLSTLIEHSMAGLWILIFLPTVLSFFASRWKVCYRSQLWGAWGVGFLLSLGLLLSTILEAGLFLHAGGYHPSLTGLEKVAALEIMGFSGVAIVPIVVSFFIVKRRLGAPIPRFVLLGACTGCAILLAIGIGGERASRVDWTLLIRDTDGKPIEGARVSWKLYGYGDGGKRPAQPSDQGLNSLSDAQGRVMAYGREGLYEMIGRVQKAGYADIEFSIDMAYNEWQELRDVRFESDRAHPHQSVGVPAKGKFSLVVPLTPENKLVEAEPMYQFEMDNKMAFDGPPVVLDVASGKVAPIGDFAFSLRLDGRSEKDPDYTLLLQAQNNAGFILTNERFPFNAPENGYQTQMAIHQKATDTNYNSRQTFHFYAKTHDVKYGVVWFEVNVPRIGDMANCNATIRYNPSGSRNLEFDQNKWINR